MQSLKEIVDTVIDSELFMKLYNAFMDAKSEFTYNELTEYLCKVSCELKKHATLNPVLILSESKSWIIFNSSKEHSFESYQKRRIGLNNEIQRKVLNFSITLGHSNRRYQIF